MKKSIYSLLAIAMLLSACKSEIIDYSLPEITTLDATTITYRSAILHGAITGDIPYESYVWRAFDISTSPNFDSSERCFVDKQPVRLSKDDMSSFSASVFSLSPSTTYYYRAVILKNSNLSADIYGNVKSFTTSETPVDPPVSTPKVEFTVQLSSVTSSTVIVSASCKAENCTITKIGDLLGDETCSTPTINNSLDNSTYDNYTSISFQWYSLNPSTQYYVRIYAVDTENNVYYSAVYPFTTKDEQGGSLTVNDFIGTYTLTAYSPWESKTVTWTDLQIIPYNGDTVVAVGFDDSEELRAVGIFDQGLQKVRFESEWYFEAYQFNYNSQACVAQFMPAYYSSAEKKAYTLDSGGKFARGEICLKKSSGNTYNFVSCDGATFDNYYANGFIFDYYSLSDWSFVGSSNVYVNASMQQTSTTTNRALPAKKQLRNKVKQQIQYENNNAHRHSAACRAYKH